MKKFITPYYVLAAMLLVLMASSCKKDAATKSSTTTSAATVIPSFEAILAGTVSSSADTTVKDTVYMVGCFPGGGAADSVAFSALPSAIGTYLTANYVGYTFKKAYKTLTKSGTADGYVVLITFNGNPVGLKFDTSGNFVAVLEQMDKHDLGQPGGGPHPGGPFPNRGGQPDTVALNALPAAITTYFTTTYPADTLLHAAKSPDGGYVVISTDNGLFATAFNSKPAFVSRIKILPPPGKPAAVTQSNLPAAITTYLTATYPGYVFDQAFSNGPNGTINRYVVIIEENSTRYAITFDGSGNFLKSEAIR